MLKTHLITLFVTFLHLSVSAQYLQGHYITNEGEKVTFQMEDFRAQKAQLFPSCSPMLKIIVDGKKKRLKAKDVQLVQIDSVDDGQLFILHSLKVRNYDTFGSLIEEGEVDMYWIPGGDCQGHFVFQRLDQDARQLDRNLYRRYLPKLMNLDEYWQTMLETVEYEELPGFIAQYNSSAEYTSVR
jgi:hypothetical protein